MGIRFNGTNPKIHTFDGNLIIKEPQKTIEFDTNIYEISYINIKNGIIHITKKEQSEWI